MTYEPLDELRVSPSRARVYEEGWQSWSPTSWYRAGQTSRRPAQGWQHTMRFRGGVPLAPTGFQGEGLLVVDPGTGDPARVYAAVDAFDQVASIRATRAGDTLTVSADGDVSVTLVEEGPGAGLASFGERFAAGAGVAGVRAAPTVWCSWYRYFVDVTESDIEENLAAIVAHDLPVDVVQLDDGWQAGIGDWGHLSGRFTSLPHLVDTIRGAGKRAGIWLAPFTVGADSRLAREHPDWLVGDAGVNWDQPLRGLDLTHPDARDHLSAVFRNLREAGFDYFKLDFLYAGAVPGARRADSTGVAAYRSGLQLIRDAVGPSSYLLGCGAPILPSVGLVDGMRVSPDTFHENGQGGGGGLRGEMSLSARAWQHGRFWVNDPDCFVARPSYPLRAPWAAVIERFGGLRSTSDRIAELDDWGLDATRRLLGSAPPPRPFAQPTDPRLVARSLFESTIDPLLAFVYPDAQDAARTQLLELADRYLGRVDAATAPPDETTAVLITYGDAIRGPGEVPLATLRRVLHDCVGGALTDVHLLPMFPSTSDDGFAVVDYRAINPDLGDWDDVAALRRDYRLMFDFVANHVSSRCAWFTDWLDGDRRYDGYFVEFDPEFDASKVTRPRTSPLFHDFPRADGTVAKVWTTFGDDQIDLNLANVPTFLELTDVLLGYVVRGAAMIRLDAIGFLWNESGTSCLSLPQTHAIVKLWRAVVDYVRPGTQIVTETNVPHAENLSYFGDGTDEAHQVYQFALPPLVLHSFTAGSTETLSRWAVTITPISETCTYFNFLASHDGIGMRPSEGLLTDDERAALVQRVLANGGRASMKSNPDGSEAVYELNINYLDALADGDELTDPAVVAAKGLAAHAILCSVIGVPAIYYHSLFGSSLDRTGMEVSGINRRINREVLDADRLVDELTTDLRRRTVFAGITHLLTVRGQHPAFSPYGPQSIELLDPRVFAVRRGMGSDDALLCLANVTNETVDLPTVSGTDVLTGDDHPSLSLPPYGYVWLRTPAGR